MDDKETRKSALSLEGWPIAANLHEVHLSSALLWMVADVVYGIPSCGINNVYYSEVMTETANRDGNLNTVSSVKRPQGTY